MSDDLEKTSAFRVPPGAMGPTSCIVCGCRLERIDDGSGWRHFRSDQPGQDARGDRPACLERLHDGGGRPLAQTIPA